MKFYKFKFGLRALLFACLFLAVVLATVGDNYRRSRLDQHKIQQLRDAAGDYDIEEKFEFAEADSPNFLSKLAAAVQFFPRVKSLSLTFATDEDLRLISRLSDLRSLEIGNCSKLSSLKPLASLRQLQVLGLTGADYGNGNANIENLEGFESLTNLRQVSLHMLDNLKSIRGLNDCSKLTHLKLFQCGSLCDLSGIQSLSKLKILSLQECYKIEDCSLLRNLHELVDVNLDGTKIQNVDFLSQTKGLEKLGVFCCRSLRNLDGIPLNNKLQTLVPRDCIHLEKFDFAQFKHLTSASFSNLRLLDEMKINAPNQTLTALSFYDCPRIEDFEWIKKFPNLQTLSSDAAIPLEIIKLFKNLKSISVFRCNQSNIIEQLGRHKFLERLSIEQCPSIIDLKGISKLRKLKWLWIRNCDQFSDIGAVSELKNLSSAKFSECRSLTNVDPLAEIPTLKELSLEDNKNLTDAKSVQSAAQITRIELRGSPADQEVYPEIERQNVKHHSVTNRLLRIESDPISQSIAEFLPNNVQNLLLQDMPQLQNLDCLASCSRLKSIAIYNCSSLKSLPKGFDYKRLTRLVIVDCQNIAGLPDFSEMPHLKYLQISGCPLLNQRCQWQHLAGLNFLEMGDVFADANLLHLNEIPIERRDHNYEPRLSHITIRSCELSELSNISLFERFPHLLDLRLHACHHLIDLQGFTRQENQRFGGVSISNCKSFSSTKGISKFNQLTSLTVEDCPSFVDLCGVSTVKNFHAISLLDCDRLKDLQPLIDAGLEGVVLLKLSIPNEEAVHRILNEGLPNLVSLKVAKLSDSNAISKLRLGKKLTQLEVNDCDGLINLDFLGVRQRGCLFSKISVASAQNLSNIDAAGDLLCEELEIINCPKISTENVEHIKEVWPLSKISNHLPMNW